MSGVSINIALTSLSHYYFINTIEFVVFGNESIKKKEVRSLKAAVAQSNAPPSPLPWQKDISSRNESTFTVSRDVLTFIPYNDYSLKLCKIASASFNSLLGTDINLLLEWKKKKFLKRSPCQHFPHTNV